MLLVSDQNITACLAMEEKKNQKKSKKKGFGGSAGKAEQSNAAKVPFPQLKKSKFGRDNQFAEYLDPGEVSRGLQEGSLIEGAVRINPKVANSDIDAESFYRVV